MGIVETIQVGDLKAVKEFLKQGADVNSKYKDDGTLLIYASANEKTEIVRFLIEQGANVNEANKHKWTPLHYATFWGSFPITKLLIEHQADVTKLDNFFSTPLENATSEKHHHLVLLFHKCRHLLNENDKNTLQEIKYRCCFKN